MCTISRVTKKKTPLLRLLFLSWAIAVLTVGCGAPQPTLVFAEGTPSDLQELATGVWEEFLAAFPNQRDCMGEVTLEGDWNLRGSRAFYLPDRAKLVLRIPATAPHLRHSLSHELAHHIEHVCSDHIRLRQQFLKAQDLSSDMSWFDGPTWEETPSELYAEAVVRVLFHGSAFNHRMSLTPEAIGAVKKWGGGG